MLANKPEQEYLEPLKLMIDRKMNGRRNEETCEITRRNTMYKATQAKTTQLNN